jgi:hypothetical protein
MTNTYKPSKFNNWQNKLIIKFNENAKISILNIGISKFVISSVAFSHESTGTQVCHLSSFLFLFFGNLIAAIFCYLH